MFWYFSREKADLLVNHKPSWSLLPKSIEVKLREPFSATEVTLKWDEMAHAVDKIQGRILKESFGGFHDLGDSPLPLLCSFRGEGARVVDKSGFWLAMARGENALLLAGSPLNAIGKPMAAGASISPSADPVGALVAAFHPVEGKGNRAPDTDIPNRLSYAWQAIWLASTAALSMPEVEGTCVLAAIYRADFAEMRRAGMPGLRRLVVGSPVYVRQLT